MTAPPRLRVSLDASAVPSAPVGAGRYTIELVGALTARDDVDLTIWARKGDGERWRGPSRLVMAQAPEHRPTRLVWEQARLPALLSRATPPPDVHHGPHYTMPERARLPQVVTIHDMTFFDHPGWHERAKVPVFRRAITVAARRASSLVCDSQATADRFEERCRPAGRVFVVPLGVDRARFTDREPSPGHDAAVLATLGVHGSYVLFLGTIEPRKGVAQLVAAFDRLAPSRTEPTLVLAGAMGWGTEDVERALTTSPNLERIVRLGYVPDEVVPSLLRHAAVVAYPSIEEGFGLPAIEALACGAPLVTTTGTAMAEVVGTAALLVSAGGVDELAEAIAAALDAGPDAAERRRRGLEVAARHTWAASASGHLDAYRWAVEVGGSGRRGR